MSIDYEMSNNQIISFLLLIKFIIISIYEMLHKEMFLPPCKQTSINISK